MSDNYNPSFYNGYWPEVGELSVDGPSRGEGKKAFTWTFEAKGSDKKVPVEVLLIWGESGDKGLSFKAKCQWLPEPVVDTDIERLRRTVEASLMEQAHLISHVRWENWLEVVVRGEESCFEDSRHSARGGNLHIQIKKLKRGVHPDTGEALTINSSGYVGKFPKPNRIGERPGADPAHGIRIHDATDERSYVPETPENRQAIEIILARMAQLRMSLAEMLSQEAVQGNLDRVEATLRPLLAAPQAGTAEAADDVADDTVRRDAPRG